MCQHNTAKKKPFWFKPFFLYSLAIVLGTLTGFSDISLLKNVGVLIADVFIRLFKCISLPIIALSIIVTLSNYCSKGAMPTIWRRTMFYTLLTTLIAAALSCLLYLIIQPANLAIIPKTVDVLVSTTKTTGYIQFLTNLIPSNILMPFLDNQVISVLFMGIVIGMAIRFIPDDEPRHTITHFFRGAHGLFMVMTRWIIMIIPVGLFGFITTSVISLRSGVDIKGLSQYLLIIVLANLIQGFIILPVWLKTQGIRPFVALRAMLPALSLAFFSKSSVGTLPVTMDTIEKNLNVDPAISRFVLPLCTSINMNGCAAFIFTTVIYLMQNHGIHLSLATMLVWVVIATVAAIGNAGIPMGCFFLSTSLLASMNVPITLMGLILPFYSLIDMLETSLNVWSDSCVTKVVDEQLKINSQINALDAVDIREELLTNPND